MNNIFKLVKVGLISALRGQLGKKRKIKKPLIALLMLVWLGPLIFSFSELIRMMYELFDSFNQGDVIIVFGLLVTTMVVFIFGIFYTISSYYMSKDIPTYLALPLKAWEITSARFILVLLYEYLTMLIFFLPVIIGYGIASGAGIVFYLLSLIIFILLPILPLALASVIVMGIMSFSKKAMNKDRFTMVASLLGLGIGVGLNIGFQNLARSAESSEGLEQLIISGKLSLGEEIGRYFPGLLNAVKVLTEQDVLQLLIYILIAVISFTVFILVAKALYFRGVIGINQQIARRDFDIEKSRGFEATAPVKAYFIKEIKLIFRTPIYFMNLVLIDILLPVMMVVPLFVSLGGEEVVQIVDLLKGIVSNGILVTGAFIVFLFISSMNGITATTISREGKQLYIMKYIPMDYKDQLNAKLLSGMLVSTVGMIVVTIGIAVILQVSIYMVVLMLLAGLNAVVFTRIIGLMIDSARPKLKWDNEVSAVKQNMNLVLNMLGGIGMAGISVLFLVFVSTSFFINILVFIVVIFILNLGLYKLLQKKFPGMIERLE